MQHEDTRTAMAFAGLTAYETWTHYCNMGGYSDYFEFDAYLHGVVPLETDDADLVSQAVNELIDDDCPDAALFCRAPYSWQPTPGDADLMIRPRPYVGPDSRSQGGRPGIPLPPGADAELLGHIADAVGLGWIVPSDIP